MTKLETYKAKAKKAANMLGTAYKQKNNTMYEALRSQALKEFKQAEDQLNKMGVTNICQALNV